MLGTLSCKFESEILELIFLASDQFSEIVALLGSLWVILVVVEPVCVGTIS